MIHKPSRILFFVQIVVDLLLVFAFGLGLILLVIHVLQYLNQSMTIGDKSVVLRTGILNVTTHDMKYSKINSINIRRNILGRILGYGTVIIFTGNDISGIHFKSVDNPLEIKKILDAKIDENN